MVYEAGTHISEIMKDPEIGELMRECARSTKTFCKTFLPHIFSAPFSKKIHDPIFEILDDDTANYFACAAPRGGGKTKLALAWTAQRILFGKSKYVVLVSCSEGKAMELLADLKTILTETPLITRIFGDLEGKLWSKEAIITSTGVKVVCRGVGQQVRGLVNGEDRPDTIVVDDLEDPKEVKNPELRKENKRWLNSDLLPCVGLVNKMFRIAFWGTILHQDSLLEDLLSKSGFNTDDLAGLEIEESDIEREQWRTLRLELCDDNFNSNWPENISKSQLMLKYLKYKKSGDGAGFFKEFRSMPVPNDDEASYKAEHFKYYDESSKEFQARLPFIENAVLVDPAKSVTKKSDFTAIVGVGIDCQKNHIYVRDIVNEKLHPDELYAEAFAMADRLKVRIIGIEVTTLKDFVMQPFRNEMLRRRRNYELVELHAKGKKEERMSAPAGYYRQGLILHNPRVCKVLETQELGFPVSAKDDVHDCFSYFIQLMEDGNRYFQPLDMDDEKPEDIEREFADLYDGDESVLDMEACAVA